MPTFKEQNEKAKDTLRKLCHNPSSFTMKVPADEENDTDLILAKALKNADTMIKIFSTIKELPFLKSELKAAGINVDALLNGEDYRL